METFLTVAWLSLTALDVGMTEYALSTGRYMEGNPVVANRGVRVTLNVAPVVAYFWRKDHMGDRERKIALVTLTTVKVGVFTHNVIQLRKGGDL